MTLPKNTLKYDDYSLHDLRKFATDRKLPCKHASTKVYKKKTNRKKSQVTKENVERRKLLDTLRRSDATATFRFFDLPLELVKRIRLRVCYGELDRAQGSGERRLGQDS
jgi:hypothetical protein